MLELLLQPKYIFAAFNALMMLLSFVQGYKAGKRRAAQEIFQVLGVPEGYEITGVSYRPKGIK